MSEFPALVVGAGGHAKVVVAALHRLGRRVVGLVDSAPQAVGRTLLGVPVLGDDQWLLSQNRDGIELVLGVGSVGIPLLRQRLFEAFRRSGFAFATLVDPSAVIGPEVVMGHGVQVLAGALVQPSVQLHDNALLNTGVRVDHDCHIGAHCHIAPGCTLSGSVQVGPSCHLGAGSVVIQGLEIGAGVLVGAGSVVIRSLADGAIVMGNPARERTS